MAKKQKEKKEKKVVTNFMIWNIPEELKNDFKARCAKDKRHMREVIIEFMDLFVSA